MDFVHDALSRAGVELANGPHREVLDGSNALRAHFERTHDDSQTPELAALWADTVALLALIDANPGLHDQLDQAAWGHVANAVERVASSPNYVPDEGGLPPLTTMLAVLERLSSSRYPESIGVEQ